MIRSSLQKFQQNEDISQNLTNVSHSDNNCMMQEKCLCYEELSIENILYPIDKNIKINKRTGQRISPEEGGEKCNTKTG